MIVYLKTLVAVACILTLNYFLAVYQTFTIEKEVLNVFFGLFGVIYAIIIGFAIYLVLDDYNEVKSYIYAEVNELQDFRDYLMYVDNQDDLVQEIRTKIKQYVQAVVQKEWPAMAKNKDIDMDTPPEIYAIMKSINKIKPTNQSDITALERLIQSIGNITTYRTDRLLASHTKLPALVQHIIFILSLFIVVIFTLIPISNFWVNMGLNALNTFGIALIYFVIIDLNDPFAGVWCISPKPFEDLLKRFEEAK